MVNRDEEAYEIREEAADLARDRKSQNHPTNGEEDDHKNSNGHRNFIANYSKALPHHPINHANAGEVIRDEYVKLLDALESGKQNDFNKISIGVANGRKLTNPQSGFAFDLEGPDSHDLAIKKSPRIDGEEAAGEMAELYWMALCRDIPFLDFGTDSTIAEAAADLANYDKFPNVEVGIIKSIDNDDEDQIYSTKFEIPNEARTITPDTVFRGFTKGDLVGPYISQFLYKDIKWGSQILRQLQERIVETDYMINYVTWLEVQNGEDKPPEAFVQPIEYRHIWTPRDLARYVHLDALYQAYLGACLILFRDGYKFDPLFPYQSASSKEMGFGTFGPPHILSLVTEVATRALKCVWYQKWLVHRRLRPEAVGGLIHRQLNSTLPTPTANLTAPNPPYPIHPNILNKTGNTEILGKIRNKYGTYLLPQAFPEGSPTHPAYGAGHATVAGACVTILKAWFDEEQNIINPEIPKSTNLAELENYTGPQLTVGGELNKIAANIAIGRNWAGVHYRSDYTESVVLGEQIALGILQEQAETYNEKFACRLTRFNGQKIEFDGKKIKKV